MFNGVKTLDASNKHKAKNSTHLKIFQIRVIQNEQNSSHSIIWLKTTNAITLLTVCRIIP